MLICLFIAAAIFNDLSFGGRNVIRAAIDCMLRSGVKAVRYFPSHVDPCEGSRIEKYRRGA